MVEFALALPLVLALVFGLIEAGRLFFIYSAVNAASHEAARYGSAVGDVGGAIEHYRDCAGIRAAAKRIGGLAGVSDAGVNISYDHGPGSGSSFASCPLPSDENLALGDRVIIQVTANYQPIVPLVNFSSFPINSVTRRTVLSDVTIEGTAPPPIIPDVSFATASQSSNEGVSKVEIEVVLSSYTTNTIYVPYTVSGTASQGASLDYTISESPLIIIPGKTSGKIVLTVNDDNIDEPNETVVVTMGDPTNGTKVSPSEHTVTIVDNDHPPVVSFTSSSQSSPEQADQVIGLQMSNPSAWDVTVPFTVTGDAQGSGVDYTITASPIVIPAGNTTASIVINVNDDLLDEYDETVVVTLGNPVNGTKGSPKVHTATIVDNDDPPVVSFAWASQSAEEAAGSMTVLVQIDTPSSKDITVPYTVSGTAEQGVDYTITASPVNIPAGDTSALITITILDDGDPTEGDETVVVTITNPVNATKGSPSVHTATITNTWVDPYVAFTSSSQTVDEGVGTVTLTAVLDHASPDDVAVPFSVSGSATSGPGEDFTVTSSPLIIHAGNSSADITISVNDDLLDEDDETITIAMGTPTGATKSSPSLFTATITDNDDPPGVFFTSSSQSGDESIGSMTITVQLSRISSKEVTVPFTVSGSASQGSTADFIITGSPVSIPAGSSSADIVITVNDDNLVETDETVIVTMGTPTNGTKASPDVHTATILDNEPVCPAQVSAPQFGSGVSDSNLLYWNLQSPSPLVVVSLAQVELQWPADSGVNVTGVTFGSSIYSGSAGAPPVFSINIPNPLWSGTFDKQQLIFIFSDVPLPVSGSNYTITATFQGCSPIAATIPSN